MIYYKGLDNYFSNWSNQEDETIQSKPNGKNKKNKNKKPSKEIDKMCVEISRMYEDLIGPATSTTTASAGVPSSSSSSAASNPTMTQFPTYLEATTTITAGEEEEEETNRKAVTTTITATTATTADSGVDMSTVGTTSSSSSVCQYAPSSLSLSSSTAVANADDFMLIGPFLCALLNRLDHMLSNSLQINFLVTGIFARLAYYPQILLRSFLLNNSLVLQPNVKSLIQVKYSPHIK